MARTSLAPLLFVAPFALALTALGVASAVGTGGEAPARAATPAPKAAILLDSSDSMEDGAGSSCTDLSGLVRAALALPGFSGKSEVRVYRTGETSARSIAPLGEALRMPDLSPEQAFLAEHLRTSQATRAVEACHAGMTQASRSPVLAAVSATLEQMRVQWGCDEAHPCALYVRSDLVETEDAALRSLLGLSGRRLENAVGKLVPLEVGGVDVHVCGQAASSERQSDAKRAAVSAAWARLLPGATFAPLCS